MKKWQRTILWAAAAFGICMGALIGFSPYGVHDGSPARLMRHSVEINASADSAFRFLGKSANAQRWSLFVNHITPLNPDSFPDGSAGSRRRCFCKADETGRQWDELITEVVPGKKRQLTLYNLIGFPITARHLATEQIYEALGPNRCRVTFTVFFKDARPTFWESMKMYVAAYPIIWIFRGNMRNIKRIVESGR